MRAVTLIALCGLAGKKLVGVIPMRKAPGAMLEGILLDVLVSDVGQQGHVAGALDGGGQLALLRGLIHI